MALRAVFPKQALFVLRLGDGNSKEYQLALETILRTPLQDVGFEEPPFEMTLLAVALRSERRAM